MIVPVDTDIENNENENQSTTEQIRSVAPAR